MSSWLHAQPAPVSITVTPSISPVPVGTTITLEAVVGGGITPLGYTWRKNSGIIAGQIGRILTLVNAQVADTGLYDVSAQTSLTSSTTSSPVGIIVAAAGGSSEPLFVIPSSINADIGANWGFSVSTAAGTRPLGTVQWYKNDVAIPGATGNPLFLNNVQATDAGNYTAMIGSVTSSVGTLRLNGPAVFAQQPISTWGDLGTSAGFSTSFVPTGSSLHFQWNKDGVPIAGETLPSITISPIVASSYGTYTLVVTNSGGTVTSNAAVLSPRINPTITQQPQAQAVQTGGTIALHVGATGPSAILPLTYQWRKNGADLLGATSADLTIANASADHAGFYSVTVSGTLGYLSSDAVAVTVGFNAPLPGAPGIQAQPLSLSVTTGGSAVFNVGVSGANPMVYQWSHNGVPISGANSPTLTLSNVQSADAGTYFVVATNSAGSVSSQSATLTVTAAPLPTNAPLVTQQPQSLTIAIGSRVSFSVSVSGAAPLSYTWKKNGIPITDLTAGSVFTIAVTQAGDAGDYSVSITNPYGAATSQNARLSFASAPSITRQPASITAVVNGLATLSIAVAGDPAPSIQWRRDGVPVAGGGSTSLLFNPVQSSDAGSYQAVVTNALGTLTSDVAILTVRAAVAQAGVYFGTFGVDGKSGTFALRVSADGAAIFIGYLNGYSTGFAVYTTIDSNGRFALTLPVAASTAKNTIDGDQRAITGLAAANFSGVLSNGSISGGIDSPNLSASGRLTASNASTAGLAGYYSSPVINTASGATHTMVGPDGQLLIITTGDVAPFATQGQVSANGSFDTTGAAGVHVSGTINGTDQSLSGTVSSPSEGNLSFAGLSSTAVHTDRLANIATRGHAGEGDRALIAGFVIQGAEPKRVLVRAVGPALSTIGVVGEQADTQLMLYQGSAVKAESDNWGTSADAQKIAAVSAQLGAFPLPASSKDAVLLTTLAPGAYTAQVNSPDRTYGIVLVEVYDAPETTSVGGPKLVNISTRGYVSTGDDVLIAGIVITGNAPKRLLIRAVGPSLAQLGLQGALTDPTLTIFSSSTSINGNDDWADKAEIAAAANSVGAFPLLAGSKDASLIVTLAPGAYTAAVSGKGNSSGVALIEVYELPN